MSIISEIERIQEAKRGLKKSIQDKGVSVPSGATIDEYPNLVDEISIDPKLQDKTVMPTTALQNVVADAGYDGLLSVSVIGDANLIADNIKKGVAVFGVTGTLEAKADGEDTGESGGESGEGGEGGDNTGGGGSDTGGGTTSGILPFPITSFIAKQTKPQDDKVTLQLYAQEDVTGVDVLVKNNAIPTSVNDYNQKFSISSASFDTQLTFQADKDGEYCDTYGIWLLAKNGNGRQTALGKYNTVLMNFIYSKQAITVTATIGHSNSLTNNIAINDYIFMSASTKDYAGLFLLDKSNNTIKKISSGGYALKMVEYLGNGYYLLCGTQSTYYCAYVYNEETEEATALSNYLTNSNSGGTYNISNVLDKGSYVMFWGSSSGIYVWNKSSNNCTYLGQTAYSSVVDTNAGVFIWANNQTTKRFDGNNFVNCTYQTINKDKESGYDDEVTYIGSVIEDTFGRIYGRLSDTKALLYMGSNNFKEIENSVGYQPSYCFVVGEYMYYIYRGKMYKFEEDGIHYLCDAGANSSGNVHAIRFGDGWLLKRKDNKVASDWANNCYFTGDTCEAITSPSLSGGDYGFYEYIMEDGSQRFYFGGVTGQYIYYVYIDESGLPASKTIYTTDYAVEFQEAGNLLFAKGGNSSTKGIYLINPEDDTIEQIGSYKYRKSNTDNTGIDAIQNGNLIYIVQHYKTPSTSYVGDTIVYDIETGTYATTTEKKGGTRLTYGYYFWPTDKKIYSYKKDDINVEWPTTSANSCTPDVCAGYVSSSSMTFIYMA